MKRIACTGHQSMSTSTRRDVMKEIASELAELGGMPFIGITSLAEGADQIFALMTLAAGGDLHVVIPSEGYERSFTNQTARANYESLLRLASSQHQLDFKAPSEEAYMAAGEHVADQSDVLLAVWDGQPAGGKGGTADVVAYAQRKSLEVHVIWPEGASR